MSIDIKEHFKPHDIYPGLYQCSSPVLTVKDLIKSLLDMPLDAPIIYCIDDEGNEYKRVMMRPSLYNVHELKDRNIELVLSDDEDSEKDDNEEDKAKYTQCVVIN